MDDGYSMNSFLKDHLGFLRCLWDKIWPPEEAPGEPVVVTVSGQKLDMMTVLYDFDARTNDELSVMQGEELCKISDEGEYMMVRKVTGSLEIGLVPSTYVTFTSSPVNSVSNTESGFVEVSRTEAERLLLMPPNVSGSYLIRPSDSNVGLYSLSVRKDEKVIHFLINKNNREEFYLKPGRVFATIQELVNFHKINWKLLKIPLLQPYIEVALDENDRMYTPEQDLRSNDSWERPRSEFKLLNKLGEGFFGEVWQGVWKNNNKKVAIKTFKRAHIVQADMEKEINALKNLCHPNLIQLLAICSIGEPVYIVTELMTKGNLNSYLKSPEGTRLSYDSFLYIFYQVAEGMAYLESEKVVHRDLATRNVLVGDNLLCKIADFGLARILKDDMYSPEKNRAVPIKWTAPEALSHCKYTTKSDVWSFGILVYEVFTFGQMPYKDMTNPEVYNQVEQGYRLPKTSNCSTEMYKLMLECWDKDPNKRPSFQDIVETLAVMKDFSQ
ncbi:tyrosine- kinase Srms [Pelobates cultripes]|uniref:Tyrosine-protein kinase n=1 Tax=Pelobates cultripes TaxID=61616 RepID=A0AAD1WDA0_PELCU|nr:tyrosine- kinase Srms [Pelobates cultripes]